MPCEMEPNIDTRLIVTLIDTEYRNRFCGRQKRHGVSDSAAGLLACVPTDYDPPCSYLTLPTSRHHHQGNATSREKMFRPPTVRQSMWCVLADYHHIGEERIKNDTAIDVRIAPDDAKVRLNAIMRNDVGKSLTCVYRESKSERIDDEVRPR